MSSEIVSSTGGMGIERRGFDRWYFNRPLLIPDIDRLHRYRMHAQRRIEGTADTATRAVGRFMMTDSMLQTVLQDQQLQPLVEAAIPIPKIESDPEQLWMVMGAVNNSKRIPLVPVAHMIQETSNLGPPKKNPIEHMNNVDAHRFNFVDVPNQFLIPQILELWGPIFGWNEEGIKTLATRLDYESSLPAEQRTVWFSMLVNEKPTGHPVVALAMGERLEVPLGNGQSISIIESTEWCRHNNYEKRKGLMSATAVHLHCQILRDLETLSRPPLIIAETNFHSGAHRVGAAAGMQIGPRDIFGVPIQQLLIQNVEVKDGESGLRDFSMMYLSPESHHLYQGCI